MQAYGTDRLRTHEDGTIVLSSRFAKPGWQARASKSTTTAEHPGTAVLWDDSCWEVIAVEVLEQGVRYTLAPWSASHTMRFTDQYDEASEAHRLEEQRRLRLREKGRLAANLLAFITGHLPAGVQDHLASETGINPPRLTQISTIPPFVAFAAIVLTIVGAKIEERPSPVPLWLVIVLFYMFVDSLVRFLSAMALHRPIGSFPGLIGYALFYALSPLRSQLPPPFKPPAGSSIKMAPLSEEENMESALVLREPLFTLLDVRDQERVAQRYGIDYHKTAPTLALIVLVFSLLGVVSSLRSISVAHPSSAVSLVVAAFLAAEQIWRLSRFPHAPAPSVLRFVVRWMVRRYVD